MLQKDGQRVTSREMIDFTPLKNWFKEVKRSFPWRENRSAYSVLVSEIMLQQTLAEVVVPYYTKWMEKIPTLHALSKTPLEEVIKLWEGLGYYSRAKNLQKAAVEIELRFKGEVPRTYEELISIKGIGPYTAGAILSFAYRQKAVALDGNVQRVLTRFLGLEDDLSESKTVPKLQKILKENLPEEEPWVVSEALIELGATVCKKKAHCAFCPLRRECQAYRLNLQDTLPKKTKKQKVEVLERDVAVFIYGNEVLIKKQPEGKVMGGLYEFFYQEKGASLPDEFSIEEQIKLPDQKHTFTKYRVFLFPTLFKLREKPLLEGYEWVEKERLHKLPFSSGHRKILHCFS
jgi:A/G-specific adenine glycosylase